MHFDLFILILHLDWWRLKIHLVDSIKLKPIVNLNLVKDLLETNETGFFDNHLHRLEVFNDSTKKQKLEMDQLTSRPN